jgi:hypothetical protein
VKATIDVLDAKNAPDPVAAVAFRDSLGSFLTDADRALDAAKLAAAPTQQGPDSVHVNGRQVPILSSVRRTKRQDSHGIH